MTSERVTYPGHRFPAEIISHAVWLYHIFSLSLRDVELILAERGVAVNTRASGSGAIGSALTSPVSSAGAARHRETSGIWTRCSSASTVNCATFGGRLDQHGVVLDILVQDRRNGAAAKRFFKRLLTGLKFRPRRIVTDGLRSYGTARREELPEVRHRTSRYLNNRAENSRRPTRRRERQMQRFKSPDQAQHFLSSHAFIYFRPRRHLMTAVQYRRTRAKAFQLWRQETGAQIAR